MEKNILSDTDYTKGWDNRFAVTAAIGKVSKLEVSEKGANVRVIMPERIDHEGTPLISKPIPVLQVASNAKKSFAVPRIDDNVVMIKLPNGTSNYMVIGSFYTSKKPPPVTDPNLDYVEYDDGSTMQFDASTGELTWKLKGDMLIDNEGSAVIKLKGDYTLEIDGDILLKPVGDCTIDARGAVSIKSPTGITLDAATLTMKGNIVHTGNMVTSGHHTDQNGLHTGSERESDLLRRIEALEQRVAQLEARHGN